MTIFPSYSDMAKTDYNFASLSQSAERKQTKMARPRLVTFGAVNPQVTMKVDYDKTIPLPPAAAPQTLTGAEWGVALWGVDVWPTTTVLAQGWLSSPAIGATISPVIQLTFDQIATPSVGLTNIDVLFETGNLLG
jgi:hypothetical protein